MNSSKYACPHCGQNMEYPEEYAGRKMPCPACRQSITFPGLAPAMTRSSLRLARDVAQPARKPRLTFLAILGGLRYFMNRKGVAVCLLACLFISGVLLASPKWLHNSKPPVSPNPNLIVDESIPVDPPDPPPVAASDSVPVDDSTPKSVAAAPAKPTPAASAGQRGARGGRQGGGQGGGPGGRQGGRQGGARGKTPQKAKAPAGNN